MAGEVAVTCSGRVVDLAEARRLFASPAHPHTRGPMAALPGIEGPKRRREAIPGSAPPPCRLPSGCAFAVRRPHVDGIREPAPPALREVPGEAPRLAACARLAALRPAASALLEPLRPAASALPALRPPARPPSEPPGGGVEASARSWRPGA